MDVIPAAHEDGAEYPHVVLGLAQTQRALIVPEVDSVIFRKHFEPISPVIEFHLGKLAIPKIAAGKDIPPAFVHKVDCYIFENISLNLRDLS